MKRKVEENRLFFVSTKKQLRSKLPRRRRRFVSPIILSFSTTGDDNYLHLASQELSCECDSSRASVASKQQEFRSVRAYADSGEVSESSCVESCSGAVSGKRKGFDNEKEIASVQRFSEKKLKKNESSLEFAENEVVSVFKRGFEGVKLIEGAEDSETTNKSEISALLSISSEVSKLRGEKVKGTEDSVDINSNNVVSPYSVLESAVKLKVGITSENTVKKSDNKHEGEEEERGSGAESRKELVPVDLDFTCSENFNNDGVGEPYDNLSSYSELQSEIFPESSEFDFSDYTPSIWNESSSQFSDKSINDESPSPTFQLFLEFSQQFCRSNLALEANSEDNGSHDIPLLGLEDKEDEESYKMIRKRERRQVYLHDYAEEYCSTTNYGDLIIQQRLQMVHWIVEQSTNKELQRETMFLAINLLDRFLTKGYFKTKRNLQIAGIACLTLATRIEENQPFNSVRQKMFYTGSNSYSRCEVVAMEWLVQEVLKFQCFLPSMYNFLWFYLKAARATEKVEKTVKYLAVLAMLGHEQLCYWPSTVAAGLVVLASITANQGASCCGVKETHVRVKDDHLPECIKSLAWLVKYIS